MKSLRHRVGRWLLRDAPPRTVIRGEKGPEVVITMAPLGTDPQATARAIHSELLKLKHKGFGGRGLGLS